MKDIEVHHAYDVFLYIWRSWDFSRNDYLLKNEATMTEVYYYMSFMIDKYLLI